MHIRTFYEMQFTVLRQKTGLSQKHRRQIFSPSWCFAAFPSPSLKKHPDPPTVSCGGTGNTSLLRTMFLLFLSAKHSHFLINLLGQSSIMRYSFVAEDCSHGLFFSLPAFLQRMYLAIKRMS